MASQKNRRIKEIDFDGEYRQHVEKIRSLVGKQVPIRNSYTRGEQPTLVSIEGDTATLRFPNGTIITRIPIRDLVDDRGYWK